MLTRCAGAEIAVVGGAVLDVTLRPASVAMRGAFADSAPGTDSSAGSTRLLTAFGDDAAGSALRAALDAETFATDLVVVPRARTARYACLIDGGGDLVGAVADMAVFERPDSWRGGPPQSGAAGVSTRLPKLVLADANPPAARCAALAAECGAAGVHLWADPTSAAKAPRWTAAPGLTALFPNELGLRALGPQAPAADVQELAVGMLRSPQWSMRALVVTLGEQGALVAVGSNGPVVVASPATGGVHVKSRCWRVSVAVESVATKSAACNGAVWRIRPTLSAETQAVGGASATGCGDTLLGTSAAVFGGMMTMESHATSFCASAAAGVAAGSLHWFGVELESSHSHALARDVAKALESRQSAL